MASTKVATEDADGIWYCCNKDGIILKNYINFQIIISFKSLYFSHFQSAYIHS